MPDWDDYEDDPELGDGDDPKYKTEIFHILQMQMRRPEDLPDPKDAAEYAAWLKLNPVPDE